MGDPQGVFFARYSPPPSWVVRLPTQPPSFTSAPMTYTFPRAIKRGLSTAGSSTLAERSRDGGRHVCAHLSVVRRKLAVASQGLPHWPHPPLIASLSRLPAFLSSNLCPLAIPQTFRGSGTSLLLFPEV